MQFNRGKRSGSESTLHKMLLLDVLFTAFFGKDSRNQLHKPIACNTLWATYLSDKEGFVSKCFSSPPPSQELIVNNDSFYLFLFMEYCPDADSAASLLKLVTSCYNYLHQASSQLHNIEHTKIIVSDTFKDACIYVKQGIGILRTNSVIEEILNSEKSIKFLDVNNKGVRNLPAFIRRIDFLMSHFLFYTVLSFIQDVGLFPTLTPFDWTLPGPTKHDPPQECNLIKYINHCLTDKANIGRVHFQNSIGKSFIRCVCEKKFPSSYLQFRQQGFTADVVLFQGSLLGEKKLFQFFFGNVLAAGIDALIEGEVALFTDPPQEKALRKKHSKKPKTGTGNGNDGEDEDEEDPKDSKDDTADEESTSSSNENTDEKFVKKRRVDFTPAPAILINVQSKDQATSPSKRSVLLCHDCKLEHQFVFNYGHSASAAEKRYEYCLRHARLQWQAYEKNPSFTLHCSDRSVQETLRIEGFPYPPNFQVLRSSFIPKLLLRDLIRINEHICGTCQCSDVSSNRCLNEQCHNYSSRIECSVACNCGNRRISNARIDDDFDSKFAVLPVADIGYGLHAKGVSFEKGDFVIEYVGKVNNSMSLKKKKKKLDGCYVMSIDGQLVVDGSESGNLSRFINHNCSPNCALQKWVVGFFNLLLSFCLCNCTF